MGFGPWTWTLDLGLDFYRSLPQSKQGDYRSRFRYQLLIARTGTIQQRACVGGSIYGLHLYSQFGGGKRYGCRCTGSSHGEMRHKTLYSPIN
jgi:hypothetical protein